MPIRIGITGGIGNGKSVLSRILHCAGVPVYDCDTEAKRIMNDNAEVRYLLVQHFGKECYTPDLQLDRKYLAGCIFGNVENLRLVNSIVHPRVKDDFLLWCNTVKSPVVAMESAILFESGFSGVSVGRVSIFLRRIAGTTADFGSGFSGVSVGRG